MDFFQVSAWKLRGNLPHAVESTWLLTEAILIDEKPVEQMPVFAIKASYITAISRSVLPGLLTSFESLGRRIDPVEQLRNRSPRLATRIQIQSVHVHPSAESWPACSVRRYPA